MRPKRSRMYRNTQGACQFGQERSVTSLLSQGLGLKTDRSYTGLLNDIVPPVMTVPPLVLSEAHVSQFQRAGHLRLRSVFSPDAIRELATYCAELQPSKPLNQIIEAQPE